MIKFFSQKMLRNNLRQANIISSIGKPIHYRDFSIPLENYLAHRELVVIKIKERVNDRLHIHLAFFDVSVLFEKDHLVTRNSCGKKIKALILSCNFLTEKKKREKKISTGLTSSPNVF